MSTNYDDEIIALELQCKLEAQKNAITKVNLESLRLRKKLEDYEATKISLNEEIQKTEAEIETLKGGGKNG